MKILVHAHTTFSGDGELTVQQLADLARSHGFDAVLVSDHFESLTAKSFEMLVRECADVTNCLMVPGYERSFRGYHILALGMERWFENRRIAAWSSDVGRADGMVVAAHPSRYQHQIPADILECCE